MRADLHIHTVYSDGACTPGEIARRAAAAGLSLIAMTDHDSLEGWEEKRAAALAAGVACVCGWEVSAYAGTVKVHVLGYGCRAGKEYEAFLQIRRQSAAVRAEEMIAAGNRLFSQHLTAADAEAHHQKKQTPLHTMHVVQAFAARLGCDAGELYMEYFAPGKPCHSGYGRPTPQDAIDIIHATGGVASLAHPGRITLADEARLALMDALAEGGLDAVEAVHSDHTPQQQAQFAQYAGARGLLVTGGSDFHAEDRRRRSVGAPPFVPDEALLARFAPFLAGKMYP